MVNWSKTNTVTENAYIFFITLYNLYKEITTAKLQSVSDWPQMNNPNGIFCSPQANIFLLLLLLSPTQLPVKMVHQDVK